MIGGLYATAQGERREVAQAIYEHYKPAGPEDSVPTSVEGALLSLADKLDTIVGCFAVGLVPSGSRDPYALRRAGTGIVRIIVEKQLRLSLAAAVEQAAEGLRADGVKVEDPKPLATSVQAFLGDRVRHLFREAHQFAYDEINAAMAAGGDDLVDTLARLEALRRLRPSPDFEPIATAFKRIRNILQQAGDGEGRASHAIADQLIEHGAERELYERFQALRPKVARLRAEHRYDEALKQIASLRPQVDRFFDRVLVMTENEAVRQNRLAFLAQLLKEFSAVADFSEIVVTPRNKE
jgi:glycyl-tRNA synthetase beta chain